MWIPMKAIHENPSILNLLSENVINIVGIKHYVVFITMYNGLVHTNASWLVFIKQ